MKSTKEKTTIYNQRNKALAEFWKEQRKESKLTQWQVAIQLGYTSPQFVSNVERGLCTYSVDVIPKLCSIFDIPHNVILEVYTRVEREGLKYVLDSYSNKMGLAGERTA